MNEIESKTLYLVPTPIGNLEDITYRAVKVLSNVKYIFAEDTRVTKILLSHFNITKPVLKSYHEYNENEASEVIIDLLKNNHTVAIVTDAGTPGISDPGYVVVKKAIQEHLKIVSLPGPTAFTTALVASGLSTNTFSFFGFLDHKKSAKRKTLENLKDRSETLIFYEAPHRIIDTLEIMYEILGDRQVVIAREITKKFEEYLRGSISKILEQGFNVKGEMVILVEGAKQTQLESKLNDLSIEEHYNYYLQQGLNEKDAMKQVAKDRKTSKSNIYNYLLKK